MKTKEVQIKRKYNKKKKEQDFKYYNEVIGILVLSMGLLLALSLYFSDYVGIFGEVSRNVLFGMLGLPSFVIPPAIMVFGGYILLSKDSRNFRIKSLYGSILLIIISALIQTMYYKAEDYLNMGLVDSIIVFYRKGTELKGGGVLGGVISTPFLKVFQTLGSIIILTALSIVDIILLTNISFVGGIKRVNGFFAGIINSVKDFFAGLFHGMKEARQEREGEDKPEGKPSLKVLNFNDGKDAEKETAQSSSKPEDNGGAESKSTGLKLVISDMQQEQKSEFFDPAANIAPEKQAGSLKQNETDASTETGSLNLEGCKINSENTDGHQYQFPSLDLLNKNETSGKNFKEIKNAALERAKKLEETLKSFGVEAKVINVTKGPAVTRFELQPSPGVKVSKIVNLADDISLNLASAGVRIEAPIPGKAAIGIEVPNKEVTSVLLREVIDSKAFKQAASKLSFALGKDISGEPTVADIGKMPHVLIAGATGSGKSVCINSLIISLIYKASPDEVKLLMVDPKVVELGIYNGIPHLLIPVVTEPKKAAGALNWAVTEMVNRYKMFADKGVRDLKGYNSMVESEGLGEKLPQIVIIIDELADLMMVAPHEVEDAICRLAQMARAAGMHLVIATQRPSVDVITGVIKANIPSRIAFSVSSQVDSRTILDMAGAEKLLGKGDMLFYPVGQPKPVRIKGAFISDKEVENVVEFIKAQGSVSYDDEIIEEINSEKEPVEENPGDKDELLPQAIDLVVENGQASVSLIQRKFKVGYARAARIVDQMEERGIVGPFEGSKPRQVLISRQQWHEMQMSSGN